MRANEFADKLVAVVEDKPDAFAIAADALLQLLHAGSVLPFLELQLELVRRPPEAAVMFERLMDTFVTEPVAVKDHPSQGWRLYAAVVLFEKPAGAVVTELKNTESIQRTIAQLIGEPSEHVHVVSRLLPTPVAHDLSPVAAFQLCQKLKGYAELAGAESDDGMSETFSPEELEEVPNAWVSADTRGVYSEALMLVLVKGEEEQSDEQVRQLLRLEDGHLHFDAEFDMRGTRPLSLKPQVVGFGACWSVFRNALHTAPAFALGLLARRLARQSKRNLDELSVSFARVEEAEDTQSIRVAIHVGLSTLLAGVVQRGLDEPEQFITAARVILESLGVAAINDCEGAFTSTTVDKDDQFGVLVREVGWQVAPETYVSD